MDKLDYIVNEEEDKKEKYVTGNDKKLSYSHNERRFLIDILNQFKLCFRLPDGKHFIIPDLLDTNEPHEITEPIRNAEDSIQFVYAYGYLPKSTMPHIMVETHNILLEMWRTGCVLQSNGCNALITDYQNRISIIVIGEHKKKREFMAVIRHLIDSINEELSDKPDMLIPLPGMDAFADYEELLERESDGEKYYSVYEPGKKKFEICKLLEGVPSHDEIREAKEILHVVLANQDKMLDKLDVHYQYLIEMPANKDIKEDIGNAIEELSHKQCKEISEEIMKEIKASFGSKLDDKSQRIYNDLESTDNFQAKLKLSVPFINLLGVNLEMGFDVKSWAEKMHEKYEMKIFKLMGYL